MFDRSEALIMIPVAFIIWLAGWWIMFDRMVTYAHWLAWYEDYHPPTPPEESVSRNYYQDKGGDWVLISGEPIVGWGGKTGKNGKDKS